MKKNEQAVGRLRVADNCKLSESEAEKRRTQGVSRAGMTEEEILEEIDTQIYVSKFLKVFYQY